jgi:4-amino-4-deoxy-L-arabinose transferase-like glycosyltransferase
MLTNRRRLFDGLFIAVLIVYLLAGIRAVPFHGDESTIIYMSHDWWTLWRDPLSLRYQPDILPSPAAMDQDLRVLNGVLSKYAIGALLSAAGFPESALNTPWNWEIDWWENLYYGALPSLPVLFISRLSSALFAALGLAFFFAAAKKLLGRGGGHLATLILTLLPAFLLNSRRAMFEGAFLFGMGFLLLMTLRLLQRPDQRWRWVGLGVAAGLVVAAKHTGVFWAASVGIVVIVYTVKRPAWFTANAGLSVLVALGVFFALNPVWWGDPTQAPSLIRRRAGLFSGQIKEADKLFATPLDRVVGLVALPVGPPQYEEDYRHDWRDYIGPEIDLYEDSVMRGGAWPLGLAAAFALIGFVVLNVRRQAVAFAVIGLFVFNALVLLFVNPLAWQRYYLPLAMPLALLMAAGIVTLARALSRLISRRSPHA